MLTETATPVTLYFTKRFVSGALCGLEASGKAQFSNIDEAVTWARAHQKKPVKPVRGGGSSSYLVVDPSFQSYER